MAGEDDDNDGSLERVPSQHSPRAAKRLKAHARKFCQENSLELDKLDAFAEVSSVIDVHAHSLTFPLQLDSECKMITLYGRQMVNEAKAEKAAIQNDLTSSSFKVCRLNTIVLLR
jgi:hypothetical protein